MKRFFNFCLALVLFFCGTAYLFSAPMRIGQAAEKAVYATSIELSSVARGGTPIQTVEETIEYAYKIEDEYFNPFKVPAYISNYTCGITAGGVAIGFYDRTYEELIPNHAGKYFLGEWLYAGQSSEVNKMYDYLYTAMGATAEGVTMNGYLTGVRSYVSSRGKTATLSSVLSGYSALNANQYKSAILNGKVLSIFLSGFSIIDLSNFYLYQGYDFIRTYVNSGAHIMVAYGYYDVAYYNSNNQCFRKDSYLYVSTGYSTPRLALVNLKQYGIIDDCYITDIY